MNNIEPKYVTFEQAKWLKEIGFDENCKNVVENNEFFIHNGFDTKNSEIIQSACTIPEQWQVIEWLRVNFGIWVVVNLDSVHLKGIMYFANIVKFGKHHKSEYKTIFYNTPQEAYSTAFDYIKNEELCANYVIHQK